MSKTVDRVEHNGGFYVVHFSDGGTSTWSDDVDNSELWERIRNGHTCAAILNHRVEIRLAAERGKS